MGRHIDGATSAEHAHAKYVQPRTVFRDVMHCHGSDARAGPSSQLAGCEQLPFMELGHVHQAFMLTVVSPEFRSALLRSFQ